MVLYKQEFTAVGGGGGGDNEQRFGKQPPLCIHLIGG